MSAFSQGSDLTQLVIRGIDFVDKKLNEDHQIDDKRYFSDRKWSKPYVCIPHMRNCGDGTTCTVPHPLIYQVANSFGASFGDVIEVGKGLVLDNPAAEGAVITVLSGSPGSGKSSIALAVGYSMARECAFDNEQRGQNPARRGRRGEPAATLKHSGYDVIRWMRMDPSHIHHEWMQFALSLGINFGDSDCNYSHTDSVHPQVSLYRIIQAVFDVLQDKHFLLIFDGVESYDSIQHSLPPVGESSCVRSLSSGSTASTDQNSNSIPRRHVLITTNHLSLSAELPIGGVTVTAITVGNPPGDMIGRYAENTSEGVFTPVESRNFIKKRMQKVIYSCSGNCSDSESSTLIHQTAIHDSQIKKVQNALRGDTHPLRLSMGMSLWTTIFREVHQSITISQDIKPGNFSAESLTSCIVTATATMKEELIALSRQMSDDSDISNTTPPTTPSPQKRRPSAIMNRVRGKGRGKGEGEVQWVSNKDTKVCMICEGKFNITKRRKHHCRVCGRLICGECSPNKAIVEPIKDLGPQRVCVHCESNIKGIANEVSNSPTTHRRGSTSSVVSTLSLKSMHTRDDENLEHLSSPLAFAGVIPYPRLSRLVNCFLQHLKVMHPATHRLLGFVSLYGSWHIPLSLLDKLYDLADLESDYTGDDTKDRVLNILHPLLDLHIVRFEESALSQVDTSRSRVYLHIHALLQKSICDCIVGLILFHSPFAESSVGLTSSHNVYPADILDTWLHPVVRALDSVYGVHSKAKDRDIVSALAVHTAKLIQILEGNVFHSLTRANYLRIILYLRMGESLCAQGCHQEGLAYFRRRLVLIHECMKWTGSVDTEVWEDMMGSGARLGGREVGNTLVAIARVLVVQGRVEEAIRTYTEAISAYGSQNGLHSARSYRAIASLNEKSDSLLEAILAYNSAIENETKHFANFTNTDQCDEIYPNHLFSMSKMYYALGGLYCRCGDMTNATQSYQKSLRLDKELYDEGKLSAQEYAKALNNMGAVHYRMQLMDEALTFYLDSLAMARVVYAGDHQEVAKTLYNVGNVQLLSGDLDHALLSLKEALRMSQAVSGSCNSDIGKIWNNIGHVYSALKDYPAAVQAYEQALDMKKHTRTDEVLVYQVDIGKTMKNLATAYTNEGRHEEALEVLHELLPSIERRLQQCESTGRTDAAAEEELKVVKNLIVTTRGLSAYRNDILTEYSRYIGNRKKQKKSGIGFSKQAKLDAAEFVIDYVKAPTFRRLEDISQTANYDKHKGALLDGQLGEMFKRLCLRQAEE